MNKLFLMMLTLFSCAAARADKIPEGKFSTWPPKEESSESQKDAEERDRRSQPYKVAKSTTQIEKIYLDKDNDLEAVTTYGQWIVRKDSQAFTLDEFVKSGELCKWRGKHEWQAVEELFADGCNSPTHWEWHREAYRCSICRKCRGKIKVNKQVNEFEP